MSSTIPLRFLLKAVAVLSKAVRTDSFKCISKAWKLRNN
jgi:hypothetical protein